MRGTVIALVLASTVAHAQYAGVSPGRPPPKPNEGPKGMLTWVGFQVEGGTPRVFLQLSSPGTVEQKVVGREVIVTVPGFRVDVKNNTRPLKTSEFDTDIERIVAREVKGGVEVRIRFAQKPHVAKVRAADESDGWSYVYLDF